MKRNWILRRRGLSVCLALLLFLTMLPGVAFAAGTTPRIAVIEGKSMNISTNQSGSGWSYNATDKILTLTNYNGGRIEVVGDKGQKFTIKLVGTNTVKSTNDQVGLIVTSEDSSSLDNPDTYMKCIITADEGATLNVDGIDLPRRVAFEIGGKATVNSEIKKENTSAFKCGGSNGNVSVAIKDNANVKVSSGVKQTEKTFCLMPINGNLTIDTTGYVEIDASKTGGSAIQLYGSVNTFLNKVNPMTIKWTTGGYSINRSHTTPCTEDKGSVEGIGTALLRTGVAVYVLFENESGTLGIPWVSVTGKTSGKFLMNDEITITAKAPEAYQRFKEWEWTWKPTTAEQKELEFVKNTSAADAEAWIKIPDPAMISGDRDIKFTAVYEDIPVTGVTLNKNQTSLVWGSSETLSAIVAPADANPGVTWESGNSDIAEVDGTGLVTAKKPGAVTIAAISKIDSSKKGECVVTVEKKEPGAPAGLSGLLGNPLSTVSLPEDWEWANPSEVMSALGDQTFFAKYAGSEDYKAKDHVEVTVAVSDKVNVSDSITFVDGEGIYTGSGLTHEAAEITGVSGGAWTYTYRADSESAYLDSSGLPLTVGSYTVTAKYEDYSNMGTTSAGFTITRAKPTGTPAYTAITSGGRTLGDANLTVGGIVPSDGAIAWDLGNDQAVSANTAYDWTYTPRDTVNYENLTGTITPYAVSNTGRGSSRGNTTTPPAAPTTNPDGSETVTETKPDGTVVETVTFKDGSFVRTETRPDGSSLVERKDVNGSTGTVETDIDGKMTAEANLSSEAVAEGEKNGEAVKAPVAVKAGENSNTAAVVKIRLPENAGETKVEIPVSNAGSGTVAVLIHEDGREEIIKTTGLTENGIQVKLSGDATVKIMDNSKNFEDTRDHWSKEEVNFVAARQLFAGISEDQFGVSDLMTRGMVNTVLARLAGVDTTSANGEPWYARGTQWMKEQGFSDGSNPEGNVTREQLAAMFYRFSGSPEVKASLSFTDAHEVSDYAQSALIWAEQKGILYGDEEGRVTPRDSAQRAQVAAMLARYLKNIEG